MLRPLRAGDYDLLHKAAADPLIWEQHPQQNRHEPAVFRLFFDEAVRSGGALAIIDNASGAIIGSSRFHGFNPDAREIEIGWTFLARRYWGGAYNGEVKRLMLTHAFRYVQCVLFLIGRENVRSQKAVEKLGASRAGEHVKADGAANFVYRLSAGRFRGE